MTQYAIDTNILYFWSGHSTTNLDRNKLASEFAKLRVYVPDVCIIELYSRQSHCPGDILSLLKFIRSEANELGLCVVNRNRMLVGVGYGASSSSDIANLVPQFRRMKLQMEQDTLALVAKSIVILLAGVLDEDSTLSAEQRGSLLVHVNGILTGNDALIERWAGKYLAEFYSSNDEKRLREQLNQLIAMLVHVLVINWKLVTNNTTLMQMAPGPHQLPEAEFIRVLANVHSDPLVRRTLKRLTEMSEHQLLKGKSGVALDKVKKEFLEAMGTRMNPGFIRYLSELIERMLTSGKKLRKNDLFDAWVMAAHPAYRIITADRTLRGIQADIDPEAGEFLTALLDRCAFD